MAPAGKRKRSERSSVDAGENRPSPHRPQSTPTGASIAQHERDMRDGQRRSSRGGQGGVGGRGGRRNDTRDNPNKLNISNTGRSTPGPMSPPPRPSSAAATPTPTPTQTPTPTPTIEAPHIVVKREPAYYCYEFLTEERMASWDASGRTEVISRGTQARQDEDTTDLSYVIQEFIRAALDDRIDAVEAGSCLNEILGPETPTTSFGSFDPHTSFLDILSVMCEAEEGPVNPCLKGLCIASGVSAAALRQKLDGKVLQDLGFTRDTFIRVGVRQATNLLYRQANYNLLREESEGYAKLSTELFSAGSSNQPATETFEKVKALIGTFDLDVGRVLDVVLDVFASSIIKQHRSFVKLLRVSSWWPKTEELDSALRHGGLPAWALPTAPYPFPDPTKEELETLSISCAARDQVFWERVRDLGDRGIDAFFGLGGIPITSEETKQLIRKARGSGDGENAEEDEAWIQATGTLPPLGNRVAAQLLGFKLRFYSSEARDKGDEFPKQLAWLAALLIKIGFISLRDLYPHLWPLDDDMLAFKQRKKDELTKAEKAAGGGGDNALTRAAALTDDSVPISRGRDAAEAKPESNAKPTETEDKDMLGEPDEQKVQLLISLLTIGAIPESLYILGKFSWIPELYPEVVALINRILNHSIDKVYSGCKYSSSRLSQPLVEKRIVSNDYSGLPKGDIRLAKGNEKKVLKWPWTENSERRFYWDEWADNIPVCQTVDDVFTLCGTFLKFSGPHIGKDAALLSKLIRIGHKNLSDDSSEENRGRWENLLREVILPGLSMTDGNTQVNNEVWKLLQTYPLSVRYSMYTEWFNPVNNKVLRAAHVKTKAATVHTMKRISKTNASTMARALAKLTLSSPGVVFAEVLFQIESYTNLIDVVVDCAKHFSSLGFDVLGWSLSVFLNKNRDKVSSSFALLPSNWLTAISKFSGKAFKRYSIMDLSPILKFVNYSIQEKNATELLILKELIIQMGGIFPSTDYDDASIIALTGGEELRRYTYIKLFDNRYTSKPTAKRLLQRLKDDQLAGKLLIAIAQYSQAAVYKIAKGHIKLFASMIDDTQADLSLLLDFLRHNMSVEEFDAHVPSIPELITEYGLDPQLAFFIGRESYKKPLPKAINEAVPAVSPPAEMVDGEGDVPMGLESSVTVVENTAPESSPLNGAVNEDTPMEDSAEGIPVRSASESEPPSPTDLAGNTPNAIIAAVMTSLPAEMFQAISPEFYVKFWTSSYQDLAFCEKSYGSAVTENNDKLRGLHHPRDSRSVREAKQLEQKALEKIRDQLMMEMKGRSLAFQKRWKPRFLEDKAYWFSSFSKGDVTSDVFLEKCLIPRLKVSPLDAEYCFKMVRFLHDNNVPYFRTLSLYARFFRPNRLRNLIFTCTVREAKNLGRFLRLVLSDLARWHANSAVYQKEALGKDSQLIGFAKVLNDGKPKSLLEYDGAVSLKDMLLQWHKNLNVAIRDCLDGTEWMQIRNCFTILMEVSKVFPKVDFMGHKFIEQLEVIAAREKGVREDLTLTANTVLVTLKKQRGSVEDNIPSQWISIQAFQAMSPATSAPAPAPAPAPQANGKPTPSKSALKPTAPEFKPQSRASSLGVATPKVQSSMEVEDGEVDDTKTSTSVKTTTSTSRTTDVDHKHSEPRPAVEPRKSEILDRRDQIKRENAAAAAAKASTPSPSHANIPQRPDVRGSVVDRASPSLPNRPDAPFPSRDLLDRQPSRYGDRRDGRDLRPNDSRGSERPSNRQDRSREYPGDDRRAFEPMPRDAGRSSDRGFGSERARLDPPRWTGDSSRDNNDRSTNGTRATSDGRLSRDMAPPRSSDRGTNHSDRLPPVNAERPELINPERAALISNDKDAGRSESPRRSREDARERSSRPQSPRRHTSDKDHLDSRKDDRSSRNPLVENHPSSRSRGDDSQPPPAGPRNDRTSDRDRGPSNDRSAFQPPQPPARNMDPDHGRLNTGARQPLDPNFGRLNPAPAPAPTPSDIPSGPRDRNSRGSRPSNSSAPRRDGRPMDAPRPPTPEKQVPTGPAGGRQPRRSASGQFEPIVTTGISAPSTPIVASPANGVHPDRARAIGILAPQAALPSGPAAAPPILPDRLRALNNDSIKPQQQRPAGNDRGRPNVPPVATAFPPSGPKGSQSSPTVPQNGFAAPTGPASASERAARGDRRQIAGINNMLQQAGQQGPDRMNRLNSRGRGGRMPSGMGHDTPNSGPPTPSVVLPPPPPPAPHSVPPSQTRDTGRELVNPERADLITGGNASNDERNRDRSGRTERSGRHSRRSSRSPTRDRNAKQGPEDERLRNDYRDRTERTRGDRNEPEKDGRHSTRNEYRDRNERTRGDRGEPEKDGRHQTRSSLPNDSASTRDNGWNGDHGGSERGPSGRSRDMRGENRGDERRDTRGSREDGGSGRKRHSDQGMGERDAKRPRR